MLHRGIVQAVAFSPDGQLLLTSGEDHVAQLWDAGTGRPVGPAACGTKSSSTTSPSAPTAAPP